MTQVTKLYTAQPHLLAAHIISIEVDLARGLHSFSIVGLAGKAVDEAKDRVAAAIKNSGWQSPKSKNQKVVISLAPADLKKDSTAFDLAMAVAYLVAAKEIRLRSDMSTTLFVGELSLNGTLQGVKGILPIIRQAAESGFHECFVPQVNAAEAACFKDMIIYPTETLGQIADHLQGKKMITPHVHTHIHATYIPPEIDMSDITGQFAGKRALEIAIAGGHNIIMYGPAGTGKTMLARAARGLLPELSFDDILEVTSIYSMYGVARLDTQDTLHTTLHTQDNPVHNFITTAPFRAPHHTASYVSVIGGGTMLRPGEITLAHRGVLFLDEMPEFSSEVLETLREPLEEGRVRISRARGSVIYPARFILIGAMNPCSCGNFGISTKICTCSPLQIARYRRKLSGPIADRIDLRVAVSHVDYQKLSENLTDTVKGKLSTKHSCAEKSADIAARIKVARAIQIKRYGKLNSEITHKDIRLHIRLNDECRHILNTAAKKMDLSARGYHRVIKTAQTIADLEAVGNNEIQAHHIQEALSYRTKIYT